MRTRKTVMLATMAFIASTATIWIAVAQVPGVPGPGDGYGPDIPGNYGPVGPGGYGPGDPGTDRNNPNGDRQDDRPQIPNYGNSYGWDAPGYQPDAQSGDQNGDRFRTPDGYIDPRTVEGLIPQAPYGAPQEQVDGYAAQGDGVAAISSKDSCKLYPATNTVAARGDCPLNRNCIVQERRTGSSTYWKDSTGNPTPRQNGLEYRANCKR